MLVLSEFVMNVKNEEKLSCIIAMIHELFYIMDTFQASIMIIDQSYMKLEEDHKESEQKKVKKKEKCLVRKK